MGIGGTQSNNMKKLSVFIITLILALSSSAEQDMLTRSFRVAPSVDDIVKSFDPLSKEHTDPTEPDYKHFFKIMGLTWPEGSSIQHIRTIGRISITNTRENIAMFERIMFESDLIPHQVEIDIQYVQFDRLVISSVTRRQTGETPA
jgi:hypothetical protein